jgi:pimeloyl-ACP methyl ester carboxylesterase
MLPVPAYVKTSQAVPVLMPYPSLLFVHGAANGAWVWDIWRRHLRPFGWDTNVLDLRGHGRSLPVDFSTVTMDDYVADLESVADQIGAAKGRQPVIIGWSMGGLVALMYAARRDDVPALVLLSPSPPLEVAGRATAAQVQGISPEPIGPEAYGIYQDDFEASHAVMPDLSETEARQVIANSAGALESGVARRQRRRGISVAAAGVTCPVLVFGGALETGFTPEQNQRLAEYFGGECVVLPEASHWGIVYHGPTVADAALKLDSWLRKSVSR